MSALGSRNRNYNYYLLCIDCFSRMIFVEPIKRKLATDVVDGFEKIFQRAQCLPWKIITDAGREFTAGIVQKYFRKRQISHFCEYTSPNWHAGMAERANRTVRERLYRYFTEVGHRKWVPIIQELVNAVNNSPSRALGGKFSPMDVHLNRENAVDFLRKYFKEQREKIDTKILKRESGDKSMKELRAGTRVRIENRKNLFQKGFVGNFSDEIFTIDHRRRSIPTTYRLRDNQGNLVKGWFYRHDLSPLYGPQGNRHWTIERILETKTFEKEGEKREFVYVKWKGFDASYNSWLPADHVKMQK
jgi:hypothetical protein